MALLALLGVGCGDDRVGLTGEELAAEVGCFTCHGATDSEVAPTLDGVWGQELLLDDGRTVFVDEVFVRRAITDPQADVVAGYSRRMPTFGLTEAEVEQLVDYVRSLG